MGTINYRTSDYITLAIEPYDVDDILNDEDFIEWVKEWNPNPTEEQLLDYAYEEVQEYYRCDYSNAESTIKNFDFKYLTASIEYGYYEGVSINITLDSDFYNWEDKREALKEATRFKEVLKALAGCGFKSCDPWWWTTYKDYNATLKDIKKAIKDIKNDIIKTPTWWQYYNKKVAV